MIKTLFSKAFPLLCSLLLFATMVSFANTGYTGTENYPGIPLVRPQKCFVKIITSRMTIIVAAVDCNQVKFTLSNIAPVTGESGTFFREPEELNRYNR